MCVRVPTGQGNQGIVRGKILVREIRGLLGDFAAIEDFLRHFQCKIQKISAAAKRIASPFSIGFLTIYVNIIPDFHGKLVFMRKVDFLPPKSIQNCPLGHVIFVSRQGLSGEFFFRKSVGTL